MAKAAPSVTSAVESHSTPIKSQTGRGLRKVAGGESTPGFELWLGAAQGRRRALDGCDFALEVLAIGRGQQAGVIGIGSPMRAPVDCGRVARRCVSRRRCGGRIGREKIEWLIRHGGTFTRHLPIRDSRAQRYSFRANLNVPRICLIFCGKTVRGSRCDAKGAAVCRYAAGIAVRCVATIRSWVG